MALCTAEAAQPNVERELAVRGAAVPVNDVRCAVERIFQGAVGRGLSPQCHFVKTGKRWWKDLRITDLLLGRV